MQNVLKSLLEHHTLGYGIDHDHATHGIITCLTGTGTSFSGILSVTPCLHGRFLYTIVDHHITPSNPNPDSDPISNEMQTIISRAQIIHTADSQGAKNGPAAGDESQVTLPVAAS